MLFAFIRRCSVVAIVISLVTTSYAQNFITHTVQTGETLSGILISLKLTPIYGKENGLERTLKLNPELTETKGDLILPGQQIILPLRNLAYTHESESPLVEVKHEVEVAPMIQPDPSNRAQASLTAALGVDFFRIKGVDHLTKDSSLILSEASPNVKLGLDVLWKNDLTLTLAGKYQKYKLQDLNNNQSFDKDSGSRLELFLGAFKNLTQKWALGTGVALEEDLFFHASTAEKLNVTKVLITKPQIHARYKAFEKSNASIGIDGKLGMNLANKTNVYNIKSGYHTGAGIFLNYHNKDQAKNHKALEARVFYSMDEQDTSVTTRSFNNLGFSVNYNWRLPW